MSNEPTQTTAHLGRNDRRIMARIVQSNGGGYDVNGEPEAPITRLRKMGWIRLKPHNQTPRRLYIHTEAGVIAWSEHQKRTP